MASIKIKNPAYTEGGIEPKWLTIPMYAKMNPFEVLNITLMSNVPAPDRSMYRADITVVTADGVKILDTDWYGQPITLNIDEGVTYTVTVSVSDCYTAQEELSFTFTAASNNIRNLNIHYKANGIKVNMVATTGASINKPAAITYVSGDNEESVEVFHGEIAALPLGVEATITFPQVDGFDIPEPYTFTVTKDTVEYTATYSIAGITKIRINNNITDPESIIELIEDTGGVEKIRANSHLYTGEVVDGVMLLKQLDDNTGNTYLDGTIATINVPGIDVWMKLPQFWYKVEEYYTDIYDVSFSISRIDNTWKEWDGKDLIGVYNHVSSDSTNLYSYLYGSVKYYGISHNNAIKGATNRGEGFGITLYKHHCVILWLCYAYYKSTSKFAIWDLYDTNPGVYQPDLGGPAISIKKDSSTNIWGLTNWLSNKAEYILDATIQDFKIIIADNSLEITAPGTYSFILKAKPTEDLLFVPYLYNGSSSTGFCGRVAINNNDTNLARGCSIVEYGSSVYNAEKTASLSTLRGIGKSNNSTSINGEEYPNIARLTYRGDWVIID